MARIEPFHAMEAPWKFAGVYHDNSECIAGAHIPLDKRVAGKGGCRECAECAVLNMKEPPGSEAGT